MDALLEEAPALLISLVLIIGMIILLALGDVAITDPLVIAIFTGLLTYWVGSGASRSTARQIRASLANRAPPTPVLPPPTSPIEQDTH